LILSAFYLYQHSLIFSLETELIADKEFVEMKKRVTLFLFIILIMGTGFSLINAIGQKNVSKEDLRLRGKTIVIDPGNCGWHY
jgi:hypothetical protein